jgi:NADH:ubiquinone oxidoreductase subunit 5 (subunit L)/multisubunit Na+/H+ antiporter MnhA subunit
VELTNQSQPTQPKAVQSQRAREVGYIDMTKHRTGPGIGALARKGLTTFLLYGWGFDLIYNLLFVWPGRGTAWLISRFVDREVEQVVDIGLGEGSREVSHVLRKTETGYVRNYALGILMGAVAILVYVAIVGLAR